MSKVTSQITYITITVLILSVAVTPMLALAAAVDEEHASRRLAVLRGFGVAIDKEDDQLYRSHVRLAGVVIVRASNETDASNQFKIFRGGIAIGNNDSRTVYSVVNDTWYGTISERGFVANGAVQDEEGKEYRVHLKGESVRRTERGILMLVEGEMNGDDASYKLLYIALLNHRQLRMSTQITE